MYLLESHNAENTGNMSNALLNVAIGQGIDMFNPLAGLVFHSFTVATAKNPFEAILAVGGCMGSLHKLARTEYAVR